MTVAEHRLYSEKLQAELVPASAFLQELRAQKDPEELERMEQAQRIAEKALGQILAEIRPGVTEKGDRRQAAVSDAAFRGGEDVL